MATTGDADADILILGEAPSQDDDRAGKAFEGSYWKLLRKLVPGRAVDRVAYQNLVRCAPLNEHAHATPEQAHACSLHLEADADNRSKLRAVLGVGQAVLQRFFPGMQLMHAHGLRMPLKLGERVVWFTPVFDPSYLRARGGKYSNGPEDSAAYAVLQADVREFFAGVDKWGKARIPEDVQAANILLPDTEDEAREILEHFEPDVLAVDLETNMLRPYNVGAKMLSASLSDGHTSISFPVDHPHQRTDWGLPLVLEQIRKRKWTAHNAGFEYTWLKFHAGMAGIEWAPQPFEDTMAMARLYFNRETMLSLENCSSVLLGINIKALSNLNVKRLLDYPLEEVLRYGGLDTLATAKMQRVVLDAVLRDKHAAASYARINAATEATSDMALMGLDVDFDKSETLKLEWEAKAQEQEDYARTLFEVRSFERERGKRFSISAPEDVGEALVTFGRLELPKTAKGKQYSTDDTVLRAAAGEEGHPLVDAVLAYREAAKIISTYVEPVLEARVRCYDARLHPSYNTMLTATLRLSSEDPNIQNFPARRHKPIREQVVPPKRHVFVKFDYKALEARVIAMASKDRALCESTIKGIDIHGKWRDKMLEIYPDYIDYLARKTNQTDHAKILKAGRDSIKTDFVFASFYGGSVHSCAARVGAPVMHMQTLADDFWREHFGVKAWIKKQRQVYKERGSVLTLTMRERHAVLQGNEPINNAIQGTGADIVEEAMNDLAALSRKLKDPYLHPRIQIHDDLTFVLPDDERMQEYIDIIVERLVKVRFDWQIVPLAVEGMVGENWADMLEFCNHEGDYLR